MTKRKTIPKQVMETAISVSTRQLLEAGAIVLNSRFGFTDAEQAEWIELTAGLANERIKDLARIMTPAIVSDIDE